MGLVSAEERRAQAREVALSLLGERRFENLSLRDVARELRVPLSTLTYTYSAVTDLLDDFDGYVDVPARARVGSGGLRVELLRYVDEAFAVLTEQPGPREIWRYRLSQVGRGFLEPGLDRMEEMIATIRVLGGESYRRPDRELGHMFRCMTIGSLLHWLDSEPLDNAEWYQSLQVSIEVLALAADPQPIGPRPPTATPSADTDNGLGTLTAASD